MLKNQSENVFPLGSGTRGTFLTGVYVHVLFLESSPNTP